MRPPLVELLQTDVALEGATILRDLSWRLLPGEHWAVLGANGSGKSTFLRLIAGELWPVPGKGVRRYALDGVTQFTAVGVKERIVSVSPELQEKYLRREWRMGVLGAILSGCQNSDYVYGALTPRQTEKAKRIAGAFGLRDVLSRDIQTLSTGELRRVLIARAMMSSPAVLICDEICDGLDGWARSGFLRMLEVVAASGTQIIYTTHRSEELPECITHRLILEKGRISEIALARKGPSAKSPTGSVATRAERKVPSSKTTDSPSIIVEHATVYAGNSKALEDVNWRLLPDEHWAVLGANGSGKSTFLKLLYRDTYPATRKQTRVVHFGFPPRTPTATIKARLGYVSPALQVQFEYRVSGKAVVLSGFFSTIGARDRITPAQNRKAEALMEEFSCSHLAKKMIGQMSYGETRKLLLLRALVGNPTILLCDEPFDGLDREARADFKAALESLPERGTQLVLVTHHLEDLPIVINRGMILQAGRIIAAGNIDSVIASESFRRLFVPQ